MFEKIKLVAKIYKTVGAIQEVLNKHKVKCEEAKEVIKKSKKIAPEVKTILNGILGLFKV